VLFEKFIRERTYLHNVSPATAVWYCQSFKWLRVERPTEEDLKSFVMRMRERGLRPTSCNNRIRAVNAFLAWSGSRLRVPKLKEEQRVLPTFTLSDIQKFARWKPRTRTEHRLQSLVLLLADSGCRISEALGLEWSDVDMDNLLLTLHGKGGKDRKVPFSFELRKFLWRHQQRRTLGELVFATSNGGRIGKRQVLRDVKLLCERLGIRAPERTLHAFRHSFALNYLRSGGGVFHLQKVLGHSSLEMTKRYAALQTEDLSQLHQRVSMLSRAAS
jgi:integrase/recombinase XerD